MTEPLNDIWIKNGSVNIHAKRGGDGPAVILLHGFPEYWYSWHHQIPALIEAGLQVTAPDLRGYNESDKPTGVENYHVKLLLEDIAEIVRSTGQAKAHIVGHDWGGLLAWAFAAQYPELVNKLAILNAPHMKLYFEKSKMPPQIFKSWYVLFFQIPQIPEWALSAGNYKEIRSMFLRMPKQKSAFSSTEVDRYIEAIARPGALTAALNYYRANLFDSSGLQQAARTIPVETLVIWGEQDPALDICLLDGLDKLVANLEIYRIPESGHWVQNEAPGKVNTKLVQFLTN